MESHDDTRSEDIYHNQVEFMRGVLEAAKVHDRLLDALATSRETSELQNIYYTIISKIKRLEQSTITLGSADEWRCWWDNCVSEFDYHDVAYSTTEVENAIDFLESAAKALREGGNHKWKQFLINLHAATYGLAISALGSSNPDWVVNKNGNLISFLTAIKRLREGSGPLSGRALRITDTEYNYMEKLNNDYRNQFMHYTPRGWTILLDGMPLLCFNILTPILKIAFDVCYLHNFIHRYRALHAFREIAMRLLFEHAKMCIIFERSEPFQRSAKIGIMKYWL